MPQSYEEIREETIEECVNAIAHLGEITTSDKVYVDTTIDMLRTLHSQRDADKGVGKCCTKCSYLIRGVPPYSNSKIVCQNTDCLCHSPKPQANVGEIREEFKKKFHSIKMYVDDASNTGNTNPTFGDIAMDSIVDHFLSLLSTTSAQKLERLERSVEGMRKPEKTPEHYDADTYIPYSYGWNESLTAVLDIIRKQK